MADLEKNLLDLLANSTGNILENIELINNLNETKVKSVEIQKSLEDSKQLQQDLDEQRNVYRPLANKGAYLFIQINDLQKLNNIYRFSLAHFIRLFQKSINVEQSIRSIEEKL